MIFYPIQRNTFTVKPNIALKLRDCLYRSLGKRSPGVPWARVGSIDQYRRTTHGLKSIEQPLSDRVAKTKPVLALRQVSKTIIVEINTLNSFKEFLAKQEFGSSSKTRKHKLKYLGLVQYRGIS